DQDRTQDRDRLQDCDGTCDGVPDQDRTQDRDRLQDCDGTCDGDQIMLQVKEKYSGIKTDYQVESEKNRLKNSLNYKLKLKLKNFEDYSTENKTRIYAQLEEKLRIMEQSGKYEGEDLTMIQLLIVAVIESESE
nr:hypothetical protein [Candidatus Gracilibacteria bacterium]